MIQPGIHQMSAADYHALETPTPALSASIARKLLASSPLHARYAHRVLNPTGVPEERDAFDFGTAAHAYLLEGETGFVIIDAGDYRTVAARDTRDEARATGKVPILAKRWEDVKAMTLAVMAQLAEHPRPVPFTAGAAEQTLVWQEGDVWCKARCDWLHDDLSAIDDLKTTENANPDAFSRGSLLASGYDIQAVWYLRGLKALTGAEAEFRFVAAETRPPYAVSVIGLGPDILMLAEKKVRRALELWRACVETGRFPGYPAQTCYATLPAWQEASWLEREVRDDRGAPVGDLLAGKGGLGFA